MSIGLEVLLFFILILLVVLSAFFSFSEMAISSASRIKLKSILKNSETKRKRKQAKRVINFIDNYNQHITSIVVCNNIVNVLSSTLSTALFAQIFAGSIDGYIISFIFMTSLIIIFGELIPKMLAKKFSEKGTMNFSFTLYFVNIIMSPITFILSKMIKEEKKITLSSDQEINFAIEESTASGITSKHEQNFIKNTLMLDEFFVKDIMIPKKDVTSFSENISLEKIKKNILKHSYTRFPLYDKKGKITYILSTKKILICLANNNKIDINEFKMDFFEVEVDDKPIIVFENLRNRREKMAIVLNEKKEFVGIITIEDIIEKLVGEIYDEADIEKDGVYKLSETTYLVPPTIKLNYLIKNYIKDISIVSSDGNLTMNELALKILKNNIKIGDHFTYKNNIIWVRGDKYNKNKLIFEIDLIK